MDRVVANLIDAVLRRPYRSLVFSTLIWAVAGTGVLQLDYVSDYRHFFGDKNPQLAKFSETEQTFHGLDHEFFVVQTREGDLFTPDNWQALEWLTSELRDTPFLIQLTGITTLPKPGIAIPAHNRPSPPTLAAIRTQMLASPLGKDLLLSPDGRTTGFLVQTAAPGDSDIAEMTSVVAHLDGLRDSLQSRHPGLTAHYAGMTAYNSAILNVAVKELLLLFPISSAVVLLLLYLILRCWRATLAIAWSVVFATLTITGLVGWLGIKTNPVSVLIPVAALIMSIAHGVHIQNSLLNYLHDHPGKDLNDGLRASLAENFLPTFMTSATTALGFLTLNFSDSPPYRTLGNMIAIGVMFSWFFSMLLLPAATQLLPLSPRRQRGRLTRSMQRLGNLITDRPGTVLLCSGAPLLLLAAWIANNRINDNMLQWFDQRVAVRQASDFIDNNLTGLFQSHYHLRPANGRINNPEFLRDVQAFAQWYRQQPEVVHVRSIVDLLRHTQTSLGGPATENENTLSSPREIDEALFMLRMGTHDRRFLRQQIAPDQQGLLLSVIFRNQLGTRELLDLNASASAWLQENTSTITPAQGTSPTLMFAHLVERNSRGMLIATTAGLVGISIILLLVFRSWKLGVVSLVPNLLPIAAGYGIWGLVSGQIGIALSSVTAAALGIVVDDTIHLLTRYRRAMHKLRMNAEQAVIHTLHEVGPALITTSAVILAGFLIVAASAYQPNQQIGVMLGVIAMLALFADLVFLPALLVMISRRRA